MYIEIISFNWLENNIKFSKNVKTNFKRSKKSVTDLFFLFFITLLYQCDEQILLSLWQHWIFFGNSGSEHEVRVWQLADLIRDWMACRTNGKRIFLNEFHTRYTNVKVNIFNCNSLPHLNTFSPVPLFGYFNIAVCPIDNRQSLTWFHAFRISLVSITWFIPYWYLLCWEVFKVFPIS